MPEEEVAEEERKKVNKLIEQIIEANKELLIYIGSEKRDRED